MQSIEGELYVVGELAGYAEFNRHVKLFLFDVARHHKLPDFDLVLSTSDACRKPGAFNGSTKKCQSMVKTPYFSADTLGIFLHRKGIFLTSRSRCA